MATMFTKENFEKMSEYVYRKSGIFLEYSKHYEKVSTYIVERCNALGLENFRRYFFKLRFEDNEGSEFQELMNGITVNETYFFRENHQFLTLINNIMPEVHATRPSHETIRILCAPCSTGEEPYSIVLHLLEEHNILEKRDIEIVGIDIDSEVIKKAQLGKYSDRSVHSLPRNVKQAYFKKAGLYNKIVDDLIGTVDFQVANVFDKADMRKLGKFDVIFSRNMLIYFDDASRKEVAMTFYDMLKPKGFVFLGHAEYMSRIVSVFEARKIGQTLVYQK